MSLASISIQRPVFTIVLSVVIVIFGGIGFSALGVREYPSIEAPIINVSTSYVGANAEIIESQITEPLEESINGISGIKSMSSSSRDGRSNITVEFELATDLETAANDVRDRVARAVNSLPAEAEPPSVAKADADAGAIIALNMKGATRTLLELNALGESLVKERLQTISGVSSVQIWGEKRYAMRLEIDPTKLVAYGITALDVRNALARENVELPSGRIEGSQTELTVKTLGRLTTSEEFENLVIKEDNGKIVKFKDIGEVVLAPENEKTLLRRDGVQMIGFGIVPQPGSNHINISNEFYKRLEQIKKDAPKDLIFDIAFDNTKYIRASIDEVVETIYTSFGLVALIIFLFLRDWRTTVIPILAIPISLIGTFFMLYLMGFTINVLTLLGIVLAIGLVVDDAIVVMENIYTKVEDGMKPIKAAYEGAAEIFFAVISTTIALIAVFMPIVFLQGLIGRLFIEFGVVIAGSVAISAFVALTLTVMLSSRILKHREKHNWFYTVTEPFFVGMTAGYKSSLESFMRHRWLAAPIIIVSVVSIWYFLKAIPAELAPMEDRSALRIQVTGPEGATFEFMDKYMIELTKFAQKETKEEGNAYISMTSPGFGTGSTNSGFVRILLKDAKDRTKTQQEIADELSKKLAMLSDARSVVTQETTIGDRRGGLPIQMVLQTTTLEKLKETLPNFVAEASQNPAFGFVDVNLKFSKPELRLEIDREKAADLGVSTVDVAQTLQLGLSGQRFGYFMMNGKQYSVLGRVMRGDRNEPVDVRSLYVRNRAGQLISLDNVIKLTEDSSPPQLLRYNRNVSATVSASLAKGVPLGQGIKAMEEVAAKILDSSFSTALAGQSREFTESSSSLLFAFALALVLIYLVLAAQFESFRDPFIIMFTVPLALAGALLSLWYFEQTMNIFSQIGIIMLIGLVTKNAILIVEFANQKKEQGADKIKAVVEAAEARLRPILMTTASTILGILPIALALGAGAESRVSMGIAVVGGMMLSTFLTLYIIPAIYAFLSKHTQAIEDYKEEKKEEKLMVA